MPARPATALIANTAGLTAWAAMAYAGAAHAETLAEAIALAYQTNPTVLAQRAILRGVDETVVQARAGYGPTASLQASVTTNNASVLQTTADGQPTYETQSSNATLILTQPIYTGGRVAGEIDAARASVLAARQTLRSTEQSLLQSVIQAYVGVRHDEEALAIARETVTLLERQQAEIDARKKVGEITRTDVAQTQERVASARSLEATAEANLYVSRAAYRQVVGQAPGALALEPSLDKFLPRTIEDAEDTATRANPLLLQADYTERASAARVAAARAESRPTFSLQGSASLSGTNYGLATPFVGRGYDLSASAVATLPLTTAGLTSSLIRQAVETNSVDRIGIETARRQVLFLVAQAWRQLAGLRESLAIDQTAVDAAKVAFEGSRQEGKIGLRSSLDVLIAEQDLYTAEIALADVHRDAYIATTNVMAAIGGLEVEAFAPEVPRYAPEGHFDRINRTPLLTPWTPAVAAIDRLAAPGESEAPMPTARDK